MITSFIIHGRGSRTMSVDVARTEIVRSRRTVGGKPLALRSSEDCFDRIGRQSWDGSQVRFAKAFGS
jgi:hypothetical protein